MAGVTAALAAARRGCRVTLIEREKLLGGTATLGMTGAICGLFTNGGMEAGPLLNNGIVAEVVKGLNELAPGTMPLKVGKVFVLPYAPADLQHLFEGLCAKEPNLCISVSTSVLSATVSEGMVSQVVVSGPDGEQTLCTKAAIDATGGGELAVLSGAAFELAPPQERQLAGIIVLLDNVGQDDSLGIKVPFLVASGIAQGALPDLLRFTVFARGISPGTGLLKINIPDSMTFESGETVLLARQLLEFLAKELPAFITAIIKAVPQHSFPREGRRITGSYILTAEDVLSGRKFQDAIVKGSWPIELWVPGKGVTYSYPEDGDYYEIPIRCLQVNGFTNLFTAGRCISVTHEALGSTRVIGCCIPLGEQAGIAAAKFCVNGDGLAGTPLS